MYYDQTQWVKLSFLVLNCKSFDALNQGNISSICHVASLSCSADAMNNLKLYKRLKEITLNNTLEILLN